MIKEFEETIIKRRKSLVIFISKSYLYLSLIAFILLILSSIYNWGTGELDIKIFLNIVLIILLFIAHVLAKGAYNIYIWWLISTIQFIFSILLILFFWDNSRFIIFINSYNFIQFKCCI